MRIKDEAKVTAISQAVFQITKQEGLNNASISKIAKLAGVSPATVYIYYQDKSDMLSKIYLTSKRIDG
ncbi:TetR/AcrR family transcriptional regulator [Listeria grayi]|uniref:Putative HTH-type transcriptional regulator n=1 Tax=Listeria grayi FSL F6-1183 TaxID=1265827 RepID=A0A829R8R3_LISGR|nr:TetR/AcrR family transcriptional regulator [Listeria grayi]EUJ29992.1 putative HTH-type transcriptional regulator [Listeria grayi FSL F6-1183]